MGLLDWLTDGIGSSMGGSSPMVDATNNYQSPGSSPLGPDEMSPSMVPQQPPGMPTAAPPAPPAPAPPPSPFAQGGDPMAGTGSGNNGGLPPPPLAPAPSQPGQGNQAAIASMRLGADGQPMTPQEGNRVYDSYKAAGGGGPVQIYGSDQPPDKPMGGGAVPGPNGNLNGSSSFLGRALGLDSNKEKSLMGSLGAGLTAAGNSKGKSKGQALFSGAGGAIEGGVKADDKGYDQRLKSLQLAITAQKAGDTAEYNRNYAAYLGSKLKADTDKVASGGKPGAWNKPDSQKFIDAQNALSKDPDIRASQKLLEQAAKDGNPDAVAKAKTAHDALVQQKQGMYLTGVGLNPQQIQKNMQTPPGTRENPHQVTSQQDFDRYVKPGDVYINPRDGKPYVRKGSADGAGDSAAEKAPNTPPEAPGLSPEQIGASGENEEL